MTNVIESFKRSVKDNRKKDVLKLLCFCCPDTVHRLQKLDGLKRRASKLKILYRMAPGSAEIDRYYISQNMLAIYRKYEGIKFWWMANPIDWITDTM